MTSIIKDFKNFNNENTFYVFDFDDTLVETPKFTDIVIQYLKEDFSIKNTLEISTSRIGVNISDLKWENGRIYFDDFNQDISIKPNDINWVRKGKRIYLLTPDEFGLADISLPTKLKKLVDLYNSVDNKCIVTARSERIRDKIENTLVKLGLEYPNHGLYMYPGLKHYQVGTWKGNKIVELVNKYKFTRVKFYDDNSKYIKSVNKVIVEKLPNLKFVSIKV